MMKMWWKNVKKVEIHRHHFCMVPQVVRRRSVVHDDWFPKLPMQVLISSCNWCVIIEASVQVISNVTHNLIKGCGLKINMVVSTKICPLKNHQQNTHSCRNAHSMICFIIQLLSASFKWDKDQCPISSIWSMPHFDAWFTSRWFCLQHFSC